MTEAEARKLREGDRVIDNNGDLLTVATDSCGALFRHGVDQWNRPMLRVFVRYGADCSMPNLLVTRQPRNLRRAS